MLVLSCLPLLVADFFFFLVYPFSDGIGLQETELWCWVGVIMSQDLFSLLPQPEPPLCWCRLTARSYSATALSLQTEVLCCPPF